MNLFTSWSHTFEPDSNHHNFHLVINRRGDHWRTDFFFFWPFQFPLKPFLFFSGRVFLDFCSSVERHFRISVLQWKCFVRDQTFMLWNTDTMYISVILEENSFFIFVKKHMDLSGYAILDFSDPSNFSCKQGQRVASMRRMVVNDVAHVWYLTMGPDLRIPMVSRRS